MTTDATTRVHILAVYLRGHESACCVRMESAEAAHLAVAWAAVQWLRKCPQDRAGSWLITKGGKAIVVTEAGVGESNSEIPIAVFDPREVAGVQYVARNVEAWKEE